MGCGGEDIQLSPAARKKIPFTIECKNTEKLALNAAYRQAKHHRKDGVEPVVIFSKNHAKTYTAVRAEHPCSQLIVNEEGQEVKRFKGDVWRAISAGIEIFTYDTTGGDTLLISPLKLWLGACKMLSPLPAASQRPGSPPTKMATDLLGGGTP